MAHNNKNHPIPPFEVKRGTKIQHNAPSDFYQNLAARYGVNIALDAIKKLKKSLTNES